MAYEPAQSAAKGVIHINHGLAEHCARYAPFAQSLAQAGYHVFAHDHRGHGNRIGPGAPRGQFSSHGDGVAKVLDDVRAVHAHIHERLPELPVFIFGHSMGGLISMNYALAHADRLAGCAVWNSNFSAGILGQIARLILRWEAFRLGSDVPSRILPKLTFQDWAKKVPNRRTDFDWLSHIDQEVDAYIADENCGWDASVSMWQDILSLISKGGDFAHASTASKKLPFHLVGGDEDPATDGGKAVTAHANNMQKAGFVDVTKTIYAQTRHETLNDHVSEKAISDLILWLDAKSR